MLTFDEAFDRLMGHEGGYSDNPTDPGGKTRWGVTERVARARGYKGDMRELPQAFAKEVVYRPDYWNAMKADQLPASIRFDVFDAAVNSGPGQAAKWLQRAAGVKDDGVIGPVTIAAATALGPELRARFNGTRLMFMTSLPAWSTFGRGWAKRIASNLLEP